jgi:hypothetical protein
MINSISGDAVLVEAAQPARPIPSGDPAKSAGPAPPKVTAGDSSHYGFRLQVDDRTKEVLVMITDPVTRAVVKEIPAEEMRTASNVIRNLVGPLLDKKA